MTDGRDPAPPRRPGEAPRRASARPQDDRYIVPGANRPRPAPARRARRPHPAARARNVVTGVAVGATLGIMTMLFGAATPGGSSGTAARTTAPAPTALIGSGAGPAASASVARPAQPTPGTAAPTTPTFRAAPTLPTTPVWRAPVAPAPHVQSGGS